MRANDFRLLVGPNTLCSTAFIAKKVTGRTLLFRRRLGHGVGLCQHGAQTMATKGFKWMEIISYYPKSELVRMY